MTIMKRLLPKMVGLLLCLSCCFAQTAGYWDARFWMADFSSPTRLGLDGDGNLVMAGSGLSLFNPRLTLASVASWDGRQWTAITNRQPAAMTAAGGYLWLAGVPQTNLITRLKHGAEAQALPPVEGRIFAVAGDGDALLAGGLFLAGPDLSAINVARWDGAGWQPLGGGVPGTVARLLAAGGDVYAGVSGTPDTPATVWRWDGSEWFQLGTIPGSGNPQIRDLLWHEGRLLAALGNLGAPTNTAVQVWTGEAWEPYGEPRLLGSASALAIFKGELYVAGSSTLEGVPTSYVGIGRLVAGKWQSVEFVSGSVLGEGTALAATEDELFLLSRLHTSSGLLINHSPALWQFDGRDWWLHANGLAPFSEVTDIEQSPLGVVLTVAGGIPTNPGRNGFFWDGHWLKLLGVTAPGAGVSMTVRSRMVATSSGLYRQATRSPAAPEGANLLARLEGTNWVAATAPVAIGLANSTALVAEGETIYIGGRDESAAGSQNAVARWQDGVWQRLGGNFSGGQIQALAVFAGEVYAGGTFKEIAGQPVTNLARWNGVEWHAVTPVPDGVVRGFARQGQGLVAIGTFTKLGDVVSPGIAMWTGSTWQPLAEGLGLTAPTAVTVRRDGTITVGGSVAGGRTEIWLRRGTAWERIGQAEGTLNSLHALLWRGNDLFVGGGFIDINNVQSDLLAIWHEPSPLLTVGQLPAGGFEIYRTGARAAHFVLERGDVPDSFSPWQTNKPLSLRDTFIDSSPAEARAFYRERTGE